MGVPNLPGITTTILDGAFGAAAAAGDACALVGVSTGGTPGTVYQFGDISSLKAALQSGPSGGELVEAAALILQVSGRPVICCPVSPSTAGTTSAVTRTGTGPDPGVSFSGAPKDGYSIKVLITKAGALGTSRAKIAFDADNPDGPTYSAEFVTAASIATGPLAGTGLTLAFAVGAYVVGDTYTATCTAPKFSASDALTAMNAIAASPASWRFLFVVGEASSVANSASMASTLDTFLAGQETAGRFAWGLLQCASDSDANTLDGFAVFSTRRVSVAAGFVTLTSVLTGRGISRGAAWPAAAWAQKLKISQDLGELAAGPLPFVTALARDERKTPGLDAGGFLTLRTHVGYGGSAYVNNPRIMAPAGSDFELIQYRAVMDLGCTVARTEALQYLNKALLVSADGTIAEVEAVAIEARINSVLTQAVTNPGHASAASVTVDRTVNLVTTRKLKIKARLRPLGYGKTIDLEIGFDNVKIAA